MSIIVYNADVAGLYDRINRFLFEMDKSVSSNVSQMNTFDQVRLVSYLNAIVAYQAWVVGQPQLDLPETSPRTYTLKDPPALEPPESEIITDIERMLALFRDELTNSQSARNPSGLIAFDAARLTAITNKISAYLTDFVQKATPLDLPESSPDMPDTGAGRTGINPAQGAS